MVQGHLPADAKSKFLTTSEWDAGSAIFVKFALGAFTHTKFGPNRMNSDGVLCDQSSLGGIINFLLW